MRLPRVAHTLPKHMPQELKDIMGYEFQRPFDNRCTAVAHWAAYPTSLTGAARIARRLNPDTQRQTQQGYIYYPASACHANFKPWLFPNDYSNSVNKRDGLSTEVMANNLKLKNTRIYTTLTTTDASLDNDKTNVRAQRYFEFITSPSHSPWRRMLRAARLRVYMVNKTDKWKNPDSIAHGKADPVLRERVMTNAAKTYSHVSLLFNTDIIKDKWVTALYNFMIATRTAVDRPQWISAWCTYQDEFGMTPEDAYWMMTRYIPTHKATQFDYTQPYMHQTISPDEEMASLTLIRNGSPRQGVTRNCMTKFVWNDTYDETTRRADNMCYRSVTAGGTSPLIPRVGETKKPNADEVLEEIEACLLTARRNNT